MHNDSYAFKILLFFLLSTLLSAIVQADTIPKKHAKFLYKLNADKANGLLLPSDVAAAKKFVYVVDGGKHRVLVFNLQGDYKFSIGKHGKDKAEFVNPVGIDVASNGTVYVADSGNRRIQVFNEKGKYIRQFKVKSGRYRVRPIDILIDEKNKELYVSGNETHEILVFTLKGKLKRKWGGNGLSEGEFRYPATLAHLKDGRVAVVDVLNSRVQVFDKKGNYSTQISGWGVTAGKVFRPKGIAVDKKGNVYISDSYLNVVQVFSDSGELLHVLEMSDAHELFTPVGMSFDSSNHLYITEMRNNRISVFNVNP